MVDRHLDGVVSLGSPNQRAEIADQVGPRKVHERAAIFREQNRPPRLTSSASNTIGGARSFEGWLGPPAAPNGMGRRLPAPASPRAHWTAPGYRWDHAVLGIRRCKLGHRCGFASRQRGDGRALE